MPVSRAWLLLCGVLTASCRADVSLALDHTADLDAQVDGSIINGRQSLGRDFPATGALLIRGLDARGEPFDGVCTGTLIAPDVVLTAAHCTEMAPGERFEYFFSFAMDVSHAGPDKAHMPRRTYKVKNLQAHPDYNGIPAHEGLGRAEDLALGFLERKVTEFKPAALLTPALGRTLRVGAQVDIVGYGARQIPIVDGESIEKTVGKSTITEMGPWEIAVGHGLQEGAKCYGDSGGPTFVTLPEGVFLAGITSHVYGVDVSCRISDKLFAEGTVDERVDARFEWINETMTEACSAQVRVKSACSGR